MDAEQRDIRQRIEDLGLVLPPAPRMPPGVTIPFGWVRVVGDRVFVSGHGPIGADGLPPSPFGRVPDEVSLAEAQTSAHLAGLSVLGSVERAIGSLNRVRAWLSVSGFVNAQPGYDRTTLVVNPVSDLLIAVFGADRGAHARTAIGAAALPLNVPIVVAAELLID